MELERMTFGLELEIGDVDRGLSIPPELGSWEYSETDVVNRLPPFRNVCCDPLGIDPPRGGEINLRPETSTAGLARKTAHLLNYLRERGQEPTSNCISHTHIHVRVPGLRDDIGKLKDLTRYIALHHDRAMREIHAFQELPGMEQVKKAKNYLKYDGARKMPGWMTRNILEKAEDFESFVFLQCAGKDGVSRGRPFRYAFNTYCLKHIDTVEFRFFRHTLNCEEIYSCAEFARRFMSRALTGSGRYPDVSDLTFPPFRFKLETCKGWEATKHDSSRGKKERVLYDI